MYHDFFAKSPLLALPLVSLFMFITIFAIVLYRIAGERGRQLERTAARIPLDDGQKAGDSHE